TRPVTYWRDSTVRFTDFGVASNSTGMVHSEHYLDFGGPIRWEPSADGGGKVTNTSKFELKGAGLVRRTQEKSDPLQIAWIGDLAPGKSFEATFADAADENGDNLFLMEREAAPETNAATVAGRLNIQKLVELAETTLAPGETRLVAWTEQELPGLKIDPPAPQNRHLSLIVAH